MDKPSISNLLDVMAALRDPHTGCPWDLEQNFASIAPYTIEEAYEVADVIERSAADELRDELRDELGDLLFQVVFHARMAQEAGWFDFGDVAGAITDKLQRRHPHVFGVGSGQADGVQASDAGAVQADWEKIKASERSQAGQSGVLDGIAVALPALTRAAKLGRRAGRVGFDWPDAHGARAKISEELAELDDACLGEDRDEIEHELGDLLFAVCNLARHRQVDPERALQRASRRFEQRFALVEQGVADSGRDWSEHSLESLDALWNAAKAQLQQG